MDGCEFAETFAPDGLVGGVLTEVIEGAYAEVAGCLWLTSGVVDGSAGERRLRRVERRALGVVIPIGRPRVFRTAV